MNDIQELMNKTLEDKFNNGTVQKMISDQLDKFIKDTVSDCLNSWSEPTKALKKKIENTMLEIIENHDFDEYLVKLDSALTECLQSSVLVENKKLMENLKTIFKEDNTDSEVTIEKIFNKYTNFIEEHFDADHSDDIEWDYDDGQPTTYVNVTCNIRKSKGNWYSSRDEYEVTLSCEHMEKQYKFSVYKYDFSSNYSLSFSDNIELKGLRFADEFTLYLLNLAQRDVKIDNCCEDSLEEDVLVTKED